MKISRRIWYWINSGFSWSYNAISTTGRFYSKYAIRLTLSILTVALIGGVIWFMNWMSDIASSSVRPSIEWIDPDNVGESVRNWIWGLSFLAGGFFAIATLINGLRRTELMHQERVIEREQLNAQTYAASIQMLGAAELQTRIGAIYSLEALMRADFADPNSDKHFGRQIGDTLAAFIRRISPYDEDHFDEIFPEDINPWAPIDVESAFTALVRSWAPQYRPNIHTDGGVDLSRCNLSFVRLPNRSSLSQFNFSRSLLWNCDFTYASFSNALMFRTDFSRSNFFRANFNDAFVKACRFVGCRLSISTWTNASVDDCDFSMALLNGANLEGAEFMSVSFDEASFYAARISGAYFGAHDPEINFATCLDEDQLHEAHWRLDAPPDFHQPVNLEEFE